MAWINFFYENSKGDLKEGTKYNFNIKGLLLGVYEIDGKQYMLTRINESDGVNCMQGTVDAREVVRTGELSFLSNNDVSDEAMELSRKLSSVTANFDLDRSESVEEIRVFPRELEDKAVFGDLLKSNERVKVVGVPPEKFEMAKETEKKVPTR